MDEKDRPSENDAKLESAIRRVMADLEQAKERIAREGGANIPRQGADKQTPGTAKGAGSQRTTGREPNSEIVALVREILTETKGGGVWNRRHLIIAIMAALIGVAGIMINSNRNTQTVVGELRQKELTITDPPDGASVGLGQRVRGNTPYPYLNHYLVVTLVRTGSVNIQPALVNPDETFSGEVRFTDPSGTIAAGEDDEFTLRVLATKQQLSDGHLATFPDDAKLSKQITVRRTKLTERLVITAPVGGATVGLDDRVSGTTPFAGLNHYIIVTPLRVGTPYVQDQPASVSNGAFNGRARFGGASVGVGEQFAVQVVATKSTLAAGPLAKPPADAVMSNSITVSRKQ